MALLMYFAIGITLISPSNQQDCSIKDTSCSEIKTADGFRFTHGISGGSTITAVRHQTVIAHGTLSPPSIEKTPEVRSMDNSSIVTATCDDLRVQVTHRNGQYISESCVDFRVVDKVTPSDLEGEVTPQLGNIECSIRNTSCSQIETAGGFNFSYGISGGSTVTAIHNETVIGHGRFSPASFDYTSDVRSMDNASIFTTACEDLTVKVTHHDGQHIRESCVKFRVTDKVTPSDPEDTPHLGYIIGGPAVGAFVLSVGFYYIFWKRKQKKKNRVTTFAAYMRWLMSCSLIKKSEQTPEGVEEGEDGDFASQPDASSDELENGGNDNPPGIPHESIPIPIIDPEAGGGTALMPSLNHNSSDGGIQPSTNGCISHSVVASSSDDQTVNQHVKDDPGGLDDSEGKCKKMHSGRTVGGQRPEGHENEDEPLLLKPSCQEELYEPLPPLPHCRFEGPNIQVSDMTGGEAVVWWTRNGFDPASASRCSTAPQDMDMDSSNIQHETELVNLQDT
ncbi:uncharacterized protein LOC115423993 [Sphaeramia orbicularis]|uniref:uncharacterized protein LOC115423993 n=1 Tax=Sphaeramia orbicularis TaxID=375764 RepID=UPI00118169DB|nr:uncharacterized protein LOC115423993 [Sphaeramia orbicularis]